MPTQRGDAGGPHPAPAGHRSKGGTAVGHRWTPSHIGGDQCAPDAGVGPSLAEETLSVIGRLTRPASPVTGP